ncbi:MAG TPA: TadE/TadG family type IV pilus assembly protein [Rhizomicrobium sp.]|nr:TadE/TadG family type IV pilus assembly protein [Rhizomicrobium sp.]
MIRVRKLARDTHGATAVEFAFTAPLFMALIFGIIEAGLALWAQFGLQNAVEAAARCASVNTTTCSGATAIASYAASNTLGVTIPASSFAFSQPSCGNQVSGTYNYAYLTHFFGATRVTLSAQSCFPNINAGG